MKVGDKIWYRKSPHGGNLFQQGEIVKETSRSWVVFTVGAEGWRRADADRYGRKIPKSLKGYSIGTKADADLADWAENNYWRIGDRVSSLRGFTAPLLLQVAKLIGFEDLPESEKENHVNTSTAEVNPR